MNRTSIGCWLLAGVIALGSAACSSTEETEPPTPDASPEELQQIYERCAKLGNASLKDVYPVYESSLACVVDEDCESMVLATSCAYACTRVVATSGKAAVEAALEKGDADYCPAFAAAGCETVLPPCGPPPRGGPACVSGVCGIR